MLIGVVGLIIVIAKILPAIIQVLVELIFSIKNIPSFLLALPRRLPEEFTSFKVSNLLFQATFVNVILWLLLIIHHSLFEEVSPLFKYINEDTVLLVFLTMACYNITLFIVLAIQSIQSKNNKLN